MSPRCPQSGGVPPLQACPCGRGPKPPSRFRRSRFSPRAAPARRYPPVGALHVPRGLPLRAAAAGQRAGAILKPAPRAGGTDPRHTHTTLGLSAHSPPPASSSHSPAGPLPSTPPARSHRHSATPSRHSEPLALALGNVVPPAPALGPPLVAPPHEAAARGCGSYLQPGLPGGNDKHTTTSL